MEVINNPPGTGNQMFKALIAIVPLALSTAAFAGPSHMNDAQYITAARCQVLMSSAALGDCLDNRDACVLVAEGGAVWQSLSELIGP